MYRWLLVALLLVCCAGCNSGGTVKVSGTVMFAGQPVDNGEIIFTPATGQGQSAAGRIEKGEYQVEVTRGPMMVSITAYREVPGKVDRSNPGEERPVMEMYIPAKYNSSTALVASIEGAQSGLDFSLGNQ